jgi:hypothetical protein
MIHSVLIETPSRYTVIVFDCSEWTFYDVYYYNGRWLIVTYDIVEFYCKASIEADQFQTANC